MITYFLHFSEHFKKPEIMIKEKFRLISHPQSKLQFWVKCDKKKSRGRTFLKIMDMYIFKFVNELIIIAILLVITSDKYYCLILLKFFLGLKSFQLSFTMEEENEFMLENFEPLEPKLSAFDLPETVLWLKKVNKTQAEVDVNVNKLVAEFTQGMIGWRMKLCYVCEIPSIISSLFCFVTISEGNVEGAA